MADGYLAYVPAADRLRRGNVLARCRMIVFLTTTRRRRKALVRTSNKTELLAGLHHAVWRQRQRALNPIGDLARTRDLPVGAAPRRSFAPFRSRSAPSGGSVRGQTDEGELGSPTRWRIGSCGPAGGRALQRGRPGARRIRERVRAEDRRPHRRHAVQRVPPIIAKLAPHGQPGLPPLERLGPLSPGGPVARRARSLAPGAPSARDRESARRCARNSAPCPRDDPARANRRLEAVPGQHVGFQAVDPEPAEGAADGERERLAHGALACVDRADPVADHRRMEGLAADRLQETAPRISPSAFEHTSERSRPVPGPCCRNSWKAREGLAAMPEGARKAWLARRSAVNSASSSARRPQPHRADPAPRRGRAASSGRFARVTDCASGAQVSTAARRSCRSRRDRRTSPREDRQEIHRCTGDACDVPWTSSRGTCTTSRGAGGASRGRPTARTRSPGNRAAPRNTDGGGDELLPGGMVTRTSCRFVAAVSPGRETTRGGLGAWSRAPRRRRK
ncbi:MAG: hypothetical protein IPK67_20655 [Planctomycetes bacterium]|nr:hypothetical protein [Planctomycetota bacterium]